MHTSIYKNLQLCKKIQVRCNVVLVGRLKQCVSRKRPSPNLQVSILQWLHSTSVGVHLPLFVLFKIVSTLSVWFPGSRRVSGGSSIQPSRGSIWTVSGMFSTSWLKTSGTSAVDTRASIMRRLTQVWTGERAWIQEWLSEFSLIFKRP